MAKNQPVSLSVIKRLPRYYRFLGELLENGIRRISSKELAAMMNLTASQIRQDLNCFGGFGQQGYGYNVADLHKEIALILGIDRNIPTILVGAGNLGKAIGSHMDFENSGFRLTGVFDTAPAVVGTFIRGLPVRDIGELERFCVAERPLMAVLCLPTEAAKELADRLIALGVRGLWNFSHYDFNHQVPAEVVVENVHLGDSIMTLGYQLKELMERESAPALPPEPVSHPHC